MEKLFQILNIVLVVLLLIIAVKIARGWEPFKNDIQFNVTGLYEACRMDGGMTKVDRDTLGRRVVICTIPLE